MGKETRWQGRGADPLPQPPWHTHNCEDPVSVGRPPAAFPRGWGGLPLSSLPLVTSLLGMSKCKTQKPANNNKDAA